MSKQKRHFLVRLLLSAALVGVGMCGTNEAPAPNPGVGTSPSLVDPTKPPPKPEQ